MEQIYGPCEYQIKACIELTKKLIQLSSAKWYFWPTQLQNTSFNKRGI